jgi:predicted transcriptional regulator
MQGSTNISMPSQNKPSQKDIDEMCNRISCLWVHERKKHPEWREFDKDELWEIASDITGLFEKYEPGPEFKKTVFGILEQQGDIENLNGKVRLTVKGASKPECPEIYIPGKSYIDELRLPKEILSSPPELFIMNQLAEAKGNSVSGQVLTTVAQQALKNTSPVVLESYLDELKKENIIRGLDIQGETTFTWTAEGKRVYEKMKEIINL